MGIKIRFRPDIFPRCIFGEQAKPLNEAAYAVIGGIYGVLKELFRMLFKAVKSS